MSKDILPYPPRMTEFTQAFWDSIANGVLTTTRCQKCNFLTFPPKIVCPDCWSTEIAYEALSGRGTLQSYTEVWAAPGMFQDEAPYVIAIIDLDENVRLLSRVRAPFDELKPDIPVRMVVRHAQPTSLFEFEPDVEPLEA